MFKVIKRILNHLDPRPVRNIYVFVWLNNKAHSAMGCHAKVKYSKTKAMSLALKQLKASGWIVNRVRALTEKEYNAARRTAYLCGPDEDPIQYRRELL